VPNIGPLELLLLAVFGLLLFGPSRFPELMRRFGTGLSEFKDAVSGHTDGIRDELNNLSETLAATDTINQQADTSEHDTV
jgi:TatA/E family protein of Tat protein translocase